MNSSEVRNQLSLYLGLDDETIDQNVLPYLNSMKSRPELRDYLTGLLGNDTAQTHFITAYVNSRFPPTAPRKVKQTSQQLENALSSPQATSTSKLARPQPKASATPASATDSRPAGAFPSQASNAKIQLVQASTINLAPSPANGQPSTSAFTLDHASSEAAAEAAQRKLRQLEQRLRAARGQSQERACFCQAQNHPVSTVIPNCPRCLLVLCDINVPYSRACPSCSFRSLISDASLAEKIVQLENEHESVSSSEKARLQLQSEEEERARRAIQFPELREGSFISPSEPSGGSIDYARKAGAGPDHYQQVRQAYRTAQAKEQAIAASGERRVLTLNSKTKKVQYQTVKPKKSATGINATASISKQKKSVKQQDLEDNRKPYIDEKDDGSPAESPEVDGQHDHSWPPKHGSGLSYVSRTNLSSAIEGDSDTSQGPDGSEEEDILLTT